MSERPAARARMARRYAALGAALGAGAPAGFALARRAFARAARRRTGTRLAYGYMSVATPLVFGLFGHLLGRDEDRRRSSERRLELLREEFAAVVAHDLRNPLQAILLRLQLLQRGAKEEEIAVRREELHHLERAALRLNQMIDDLLDASRIEASRLRLKPERVALDEVVPAIVEDVRPTLGGQALELEIDAPLPPVRVDPTRLAQVVTNLLDNAAKYGRSEAPVTVRLRAAAGGVELSVEDHGPGIAPDVLPRLFDRFFQARRAREQKSGLGLGLYITKGLVEAHHGRIDVASAPGRGTTFRVWLPG